MHIGERVKGWRERRQWSQRQAASAAGISQAALQAVESGSGKRIGLTVAARVVVLLEGEIRLTDLIDDEALAREVARLCARRRPSPIRHAAA